MRHFFALVVLASLLAGLTPARGDSINTLASTGEGLPTGVVDPKFTIISAPTGATLNTGDSTDTIAPITSPAYAKAPAGSQWIGPNLDNKTQQPPGNYDFRTTFSLAGLDPSTAKITALIGADNGIADIKLNGVSLGISGGSLGSLMGITMATGFRSGLNTLDFIVNNDKSGGPTALMVSETGTAEPVPEPSTLALFGIVALALCVRRASRRPPESGHDN